MAFPLPIDPPPPASHFGAFAFWLLDAIGAVVAFVLVRLLWPLGRRIFGEALRTWLLDKMGAPQAAENMSETERRGYWKKIKQLEKDVLKAQAETEKWHRKYDDLMGTYNKLLGRCVGLSQQLQQRRTS